MLCSLFQKSEEKKEEERKFVPLWSGAAWRGLLAGSWPGSPVYSLSCTSPKTTGNMLLLKVLIIYNAIFIKNGDEIFFKGNRFLFTKGLSENI